MLNILRTQKFSLLIDESTRKEISLWYSKFNAAETILDDMPRSGRPISEWMEEMKERIKQMIYADRRLKIREIAKQKPNSSMRFYIVLV